MNEVYEDYLMGKKELSDDVLSSMWAMFQQEYDHINPNVKLSSLADRQRYFNESVEWVAKHNSDLVTNTFIKGVN